MDNNLTKEEEIRMRSLEILSNLDIYHTDVNTFILNSACVERYVKSGYLPLHKGKAIPADKAIELAFELCNEEPKEVDNSQDNSTPLDPPIKPPTSFFSRLLFGFRYKEPVTESRESGTCRYWL